MVVILIWGKRWRLEPVETFRSTCLQCRSDEQFTRFFATEYRHMFWIPLRKTGITQHRIVCGHCGHERHVRDLTDLDSPMLADLYGRCLRAGVGSLALDRNDHVRLQSALDVLRPFFGTLHHRDVVDEQGAVAPDAVTALLEQLRENSHTSIGRRWLETLQHVASVGPHPPTRSDLLASYGTTLNLTRRQIEQALGTTTHDRSTT